MGTTDDHSIPALGILGIWSLRQKFCQMLLIIQLGFELDLYQPEEMAAMYWYEILTANAWISKSITAS